MKRSLVIAALLATALMSVRVSVADQAAPPPWDAHPFDAPTNGLERAILLHDGQTYAALAQDPTLDRPELFYGNVEEQAYRASRPALVWMTWGLSLGRPGAVPAALLAASIAGIVALSLGATALARRLRRPDHFAWIVLALPGAIAAMTYIGLPDGLATGAALGGLALWRRGVRGWAIVALAVSILARETGVLAVAALLVADRRRALPAVTAVLPFVVWLAFIRLRIGVWPFAASSDGARFTTPVAGLWRAAEQWGALPWLVFACVAAVITVGFRRLPLDLRCFVGLWIVAAACLGWQVWARWFDFARVLLPVTAVCALACLPPTDAKPEPVRAG